MKKLIIFLLLLVPITSSAVTINLEGDFAGANLMSSVPMLSGTWTASYDDSTVPGGLAFLPIGLTSLSLNPNPLGGTMFDTSNSSALLVFFNSVLTSLNIGGDPFPDLLFGMDDFSASYDGGGSLSGLSWIVAGETVVANEFSGSFTSTPVPLPAAVWLFGSGLLALVGFTRRKAMI